MNGRHRNNDQGERAEEIFGVRITQDHLFRAKDLGAKWPISDYYVEINDDNNPLHFIVQVKSTRMGINRNNNLPVSVSLRKLVQLSNYYAPTFLAGVDVTNETVYLFPIYRRQRIGISRIPGRFVLSANDKQGSLANLRLLMREVRIFWTNTNAKRNKRTFQSAI